MSRDIYVNGPCLVRVKFGKHIANFIQGPALISGGNLFTGSANTPGGSAQLFDLGLSSEAITISPIFYRKGIPVDDYGPDVPADVMWNLAEARISMTLVQYDAFVLDACMSEGMCGGSPSAMMGAGTPMGNLLPPGASGNHYISLNLTSPGTNNTNFQVLPYRFRTSYLDQQPLVLPLGTKRSLAVLSWRATPYFGAADIADTVAITDTMEEITTSGVLWVEPIASSGSVLWDRILDT